MFNTVDIGKGRGDQMSGHIKGTFCVLYFCLAQGEGGG